MLKLMIIMQSMILTFPLIASEYIVDSLDDDGLGSFREAINSAERGDKIAFDQTLSGCRIVLESPLPSIDKNINLIGPYPEQISIDVLPIQQIDHEETPKESLLNINPGARLNIHRVSFEQNPILLPESAVLSYRVEKNEMEKDLTLKGSGELIKVGEGILILNPETSRNFKGTLHIKEGILETEHGIECEAIIHKEALLKGRGVLGKIKSQGTIKAARNKLTLQGGYEQTFDGVLQVTIDPNGGCGYIEIEGSTLLNGKLEIIALEGTYQAGQRYTLLRSKGSIYGLLNPISKNGLKLSYKQLSNEIIVEVDESYTVVRKQ